MADTQRSEIITAKLDGALAIVAALEAELADLALAAVDRIPGAADRLAAHRAQLATAKSAVEELRAAQSRAREIDQKAEADRIKALRSADPDDLLEGISVTDCCDRCSATECVIGPGVGRCCHPNKGGLPQDLFNDVTLRRFQIAARQALSELESQDDEDSDEEAA